MRNRAWLVAVAVLVLSPSYAVADDEAECLAGVKAIKAALAHHPSKEVLAGLQQSLKSAQQEVSEGDWFECVSVIRTANLPKK